MGSNWLQIIILKRWKLCLTIFAPMHFLFKQILEDFSFDVCRKNLKNKIIFFSLIRTIFHLNWPGIIVVLCKWTLLSKFGVRQWQSCFPTILEFHRYLLKAISLALSFIALIRSKHSFNLKPFIVFGIGYLESPLLNWFWLVNWDQGITQTGKSLYQKQQCATIKSTFLGHRRL